MTRIRKPPTIQSSLIPTSSRFSTLSKNQTPQLPPGKRQKPVDFRLRQNTPESSSIDTTANGTSDGYMTPPPAPKATVFPQPDTILYNKVGHSSLRKKPSALPTCKDGKTTRLQ